MRSRWVDAAALTVVLALGAASMAAAQGLDGGHRAAVRQACAADLQTYCAGVQPGGGRIKQCLRDNLAKLSDGCKQALQSARAARPNAPAT